jgi:hypothetical protein
MSEADYKRGDAELRALGSYEPRMRLIESWDIDIKAVFVGNEILAVYYTRGGEGISHNVKELAAAPQLEAFFFDAQTGALLKTQEWATRARVGHDDFIDPEARIYAAHDGRFIVYALDKLMVYGPDFTLLYEKQLQSLRWRDDRSVQVLPGGTQIFLREKVAGRRTYSWLAVDGLRPVPAPEGVLDQEGGKVASEKSLYPGGIVPTWKGDVAIAQKYHISDCSMGSLPLADDQVLWSGNCGFIVNRGSTQLWERRVNESFYENASPERNLPGSRFVLHYGAYHRSELDGVRVSKKGTLIVYDLPTRRPVFSLDRYMALALSPDGSMLAVGGGVVHIFEIP